MSENQHHSDGAMEFPLISFAHLDIRHFTEDDEASSDSAFGFSSPQEEDLYETCVLGRIFLKC